MILDIDVGNSRVKWRISGHKVVLRGTIDRSNALTPEEWPVHRPDRIRVSSVAAKDQTGELGALLRARFGIAPEFSQTTRTAGGVTCGYDDPTRLGIDRWLAMLAARSLTAEPFVVIDLGTAATIDFVRGDGTHAGGFIVPGLNLMAAALLRGTADVRVTFEGPKRLLRPATNTEDAVRSGVVRMIADFATCSIARFGDDCHGVPKVYVCGGDAEIVVPHVDAPLRIEPDLVLNGLALALP